MKFTINGHGWASWDYGRRKGGLRDQIGGCAAMTFWHFTYGLGEEDREWEANGILPVAQGRCVEHAIHTAGGPVTKCWGI